ncbi:hypothetical protein FQN54_003097 [Arachnomyces sp. PD_36]|nr:hypothetical protein FQN54_003097 [Arachnomyces sp. PD_36]
MRLVNTDANLSKTFRIEEFKDENVPRYAILSHTWHDEEVTFQDMNEVDVTTKKGYKKIQDCCSVARQNGFMYAWIDTCCIDKTSSTELSEAINSMYRWYREADACYAFLADAESPTEMLASRWFERGFTLQELIAPSTVIFYSRTWSKLGTKESLQDLISKRTTIPIGILSGVDRVDDASVAQRMSWAANRKTSRLEDEAYCLMGIFGINMPLLYGEGKAAFIRLQEEIIRVSDDHSIFSWKSKNPDHGGLLANTVDAFCDSGDIVPTQDPLMMSKTPWTTTNKGIHLELSFIGIGHGGLGLGILPCVRHGNKNVFLAIYLKDQSFTMERFERVRYHRLELVDLTFFLPSQFPMRQICIQQRRLAVMSRRTDHRKLETLVKDSNVHNTLPDSFQNDGLGWFGNWLRIPSDGVVKRPSIPGKAISINNKDKSGWTPLFHAASTGDIEETQSLLARQDVKVNLEDKDGRTPLSYAAGAGHARIVWLLLLARYKAKVNLKDKYRRTPLSYAAEGGHGDVVWLLLTLGDIIVHSQDTSGFTPLLYAAKGGHAMIINMLLAREGSQDNMQDDNGRTVLSHASECGHVAAVRTFLTRTNVGPDAQDKYGRTPLLLAAMNGHEEIASLLLAYGAEADPGKDFAHTPVWFAAANGHEGVVRLLLPHGISDLEWRDKTHKTLLLRLAVEKGHGPVVQLLLAHGVDVESKESSDTTPLWLAVRNGDETITKMLLSYGGKIERKDRQRRSFLHRAVLGANEAAVKLLLLHGVDLEPSDCDNMTPLWLAFLKGYENIISLLIAQGANIERRGEQKETFLHRAVIMRHEAAVKLLLLHGADLEAKDCDNMTPIWYAFRGGYEDIAGLLITQGANIEHKDKQQRTPLHWCAIHTQRVIAKHLLAGNVDIESKDDQGRAPLHRAVIKGNITIAMLLLNAGANVGLKDVFDKPAIEYAKDSHDETMISLLQQYPRSSIDQEGKSRLSGLIDKIRQRP